MRERTSAAVWAERVAAQAASGMSVAAFCRAQGVSLCQLYYWRRRLATPVSPPVGGFVEVAVGDATAASGVRLEVGQVAIVLACNFDGATLAAVLR